MSPLAATFSTALALASCAPSTAPDNAEASQTMPEPVHDLPHSQGRSFATLDSYLAYRREMGAQDRPYFEEVEPGRYQLIEGRRPLGAPTEPQIYTREELLERFGFTE